MKRVFYYCMVILAVCGCAKVNIATSKPLKVDINMRVDVYQHVAKDVESIEDQIYGTEKKQLNAISIFETVYAQAQVPGDLDSAIGKRKERAGKVEELFSKGYIGENKSAFIELRSEAIPADNKAEIATLVNDENADRSVIYAATVQKNNADMSRVQKIFFDDHYRRASAGSWFQVYDQAKSAYEWKQK